MASPDGVAVALDFDGLIEIQHRAARPDEDAQQFGSWYQLLNAAELNLRARWRETSRSARVLVLGRPQPALREIERALAYECAVGDLRGMCGVKDDPDFPE